MVAAAESTFFSTSSHLINSHIYNMKLYDIHQRIYHREGNSRDEIIIGVE